MLCNATIRQLAPTGAFYVNPFKITYIFTDVSQNLSNQIIICEDKSSYKKNEKRERERK